MYLSLAHVRDILQNEEIKQQERQYCAVSKRYISTK
jgi:hypothetical protein